MYDARLPDRRRCTCTRARILTHTQHERVQDTDSVVSGESGGWAWAPWGDRNANEPKTQVLSQMTRRDSSTNHQHHTTTVTGVLVPQMQERKKASNIQEADASMGANDAARSKMLIVVASVGCRNRAAKILRGFLPTSTRLRLSPYHSP